MNLLKWSVSLLTIFLLASCSNGVGSDTVGAYEGTGTIRIVKLDPSGPYTVGTNYSFTVEIAYTLEGASQAELLLGFGGQEGDTSWTSIAVQEIVGPTASEITKSYIIDTSLYDWDPDEEIFDASLAPYPREDTYSPLAFDVLNIDVSTP